MTETDYLLTKLIEEAAEVQQRAAEALEFGMKEVQEGQIEPNWLRLSEEIKDFNYIVSRLVQENVGIRTLTGDPSGIDKRKAKYEKYRELSRTLGRLD